MPTPENRGLPPNTSQPDTSQGYEVSDASVSNVAIFLISLGIFSVVLFVFCFGMGAVINHAIIKRDGPLNRWNAPLGNFLSQGKRRDMTSDPTMEQEELHRMTQNFPTPRLQMDNGDQDVANLHAREDLLLDHYSWIDRKKGEVRIPIERAMELLAKSGLPVAPQTQAPALMMGDKAIVVPMPLTNGFARTGYEQQVLETMEQQRLRGEPASEQAALRKH